jgi:hypothetical protein
MKFIDPLATNRAARRAAVARQRRQATPKDPQPALDRPHLLRFVAELVDDDTSISSVTLIEPDGSTPYLDTGAMRRGGRA